MEACELRGGEACPAGLLPGAQLERDRQELNLRRSAPV